MKKFMDTKYVWVAIIGLLFISTAVHAEKIKLKSGYEVTGEIIERTEDYIKVKIVDDIINTYFVDEIKSIKVDGEGKASFKSEASKTPANDGKQLDTSPDAAEENQSSPVPITEGFVALHHNGRAVSLGTFTAYGPDENSLQPLKKKIRHITYDPQKKLYYALTQHDMGTIDPADYTFKKIEFDKSIIDVSWPGGITFDTNRRRVVFTGSSGAGQDIFAYEVDTQQWQTLSEDRHTGEGVIAYCQISDMLYALPTNQHGKGVKDLLKISSKGAIVKTIPLSESIPYFGGIDSSLQLNCFEEKLYVMVNQEPHPRLQSPILYAIDPSSGAMEITPYNQGENLVEKLWPGMPDGPAPSKSIAGVCSSGPLSGYVTPKALVQDQDRELHVISSLYGDMNLFRELQRVKQLKVDSQGFEISVDMSKKATGVQINVQKSAKPVVLLLVAPDQPYMPQSIVWTLEVQADARLAKVIMFDSKEQRLVGLPQGIPLEKISLSEYAHAWEIGENKKAGFDKMIKDIRQHTGLRESSFQGCSYGKNFTVPFN